MPHTVTKLRRLPWWTDVFATAATNVTDVSFSANWNAALGATGYRLDVSTDPGFSSFVSGFNNLDVSNVVTYSVTGLAQSITYYFRVRSYNAVGTSANSNAITTTTYNSEVQDWAETRIPGNSGTISIQTKDAANIFMLALNSGSLRSLVYRLNLYAGNQLAACLVPLIKDFGNATETNNNFVSGDYTEATGLKGNGTTKFLDTGLVPSTVYSDINGAHLSIYARSAETESADSIGSIISGTSNSKTGISITDSANGKSIGFWGEPTGSSVTLSALLSVGYFHHNRVSSTVTHLYKNGVSRTNGTPSGGTLASASLYIHARHDSVLGAQRRSARTYAGYSIGLGMDATQALVFYNAWQTFQTALRRQV